MRIVAILIGISALCIHPSPSWIETAYVNGFYPHWEHAAYAVTRLSPWSLGDLAVLVGVALLVWRIARCIRIAFRRFAWSAILVAVLDVAAIFAVYAFWFEAGWGWNYDRAPVEARLLYEPRRVNAQAVAALRARAIAEMNALAPLAHRRSSETLDIAALRDAWLPAVQRAGDRWTPRVGAPKATLADPFMNASGTSGFINPLTLTAQLASDLLWFERPFDLAHEWSHIAGYAREDEANYLATVTCLRSRDPVAQYSGWLELFLALPRPQRFARKTFTPLVWSDFAALRNRDARRVNLSLARLSWRTYNVYLKSNHVAAGVESYDEVTRLVLGIPLDREGLPLAR